MNEGKDLSLIGNAGPTAINLSDETRNLVELKYRLAKVCIRDCMSEETAESLRSEIGKVGKLYIDMLDAFDDLITASIRGNLQIYRNEI